MGDVDIVGCVYNETAVLYLTTDSQERQKSNTRFNDNLLVVLKDDENHQRQQLSLSLSFKNRKMRKRHLGVGDGDY